MQLRRLGQSELFVSPVAMGCWPIAGLTSLHVTADESLKTLHAALDAGINFLDTAHAYGIEGESEQMIGEVLRGRSAAGLRDRVVIATKGGLHRVGRGQAHDASPQALRRQCDLSLQRLRTDRIDLYYLHAPDPQVPVSESAGAISELIAAGKVQTAGASNLTVAQLDEFHTVCPLTAVQPHFNMLQRESSSDILPWCIRHKVSACVYWPLMKGFLAGRLPRDHQFEDGDGRKKYPMFQGTEWQRNHDFLDELKQISDAANMNLSHLVIAWTVRQPGISSALCGAKRDWQIRETAAAAEICLSDETCQQIDDALIRRGTPYSMAAV